MLQKMAAAPLTATGAGERLARAYAVAGDRPKAYALADELLTRDPHDVPTHLLKGELLMGDGRWDEALASVKAAVAAEPSSAPAQFSLGRVYAARGDVAGAEAAYREVLKVNPGATAARVELSLLQLLAGAPAASLQTAEEAVRSQPGNLEARLALVRGLLAARELARAQQEIEALLAARPDLAVLHVESGVLAASKGDTVAARRAFDKALELDPSSLEGLAGLLALDLNARDLTAAKARMDRRLEGGRVTPELLVLAARTYTSVNDLPAAEQVLRLAIERRPSLLSAFAMLARLYLDQQRLDEAWREFDNLAERQSNPVGALTMSGVIHEAQGRTSEARARYERAVAIDPRAAVAANNLSWLYLESGENLAPALRLAQAAAEALPDSPEVLDTLGWAYFKNDLAAMAVPPLVRSIEKNPGKAVYHYHLGLAYARAGDRARAGRSFERAIALGPDAPWLGDARSALAALADRTTQ